LQVLLSTTAKLILTYQQQQQQRALSRSLSLTLAGLLYKDFTLGRRLLNAVEEEHAEIVPATAAEQHNEISSDAKTVIVRHAAATAAVKSNPVPEESNCTRPSILSFTPDGFTVRTGGADRKTGRIVLHVLLSCYCFWLLAIICDEYFIASIEIFCQSTQH